MIDMRTKFFAVSSLLVLGIVPFAPDSLKYVPFWLFITYVFLTLICAADSISRQSK